MKSLEIPLDCFKHPRFKNLIGDVYEELKVIGYAGKNRAGKHLWNCACSCGKVIQITSSNWAHTTKSCGHVKSELMSSSPYDSTTTHGLSDHPLYSVWRGMLYRCNSPKSKDFKNYGGRGISVCDRWSGENGLKNFINDMDNRPSLAYTLDRIDNNGNYSPKNCRWATASQQLRNQNKREGLTSKYKGVCKPTRSNKWRASGRDINGNMVHIGTYLTEMEALGAYQNWYNKNIGEINNDY